MVFEGQMPSSKKILFPLFSIFLLYQSFVLMRILLSNSPQDYSFFQSLLLAFLLSLFVTGIFAFVGFVFPTFKLLPSTYYQIKHAKSLLKWSKLLGINYFRFLLLLFFWGRKKNRKKYFDGTKSGLKHFIFQTKQSEFGHLGALIVLFLCIIPLIIRGYFTLSLLLIIINFIGNLYPILLQRIHRMRIEKMSF